ncbi:MAG TPA: hypothetical protein VII05_03065 [Gaiellaceae bacterium]|jgi:hypothetical protein
MKIRAAAFVAVLLVALTAASVAFGATSHASRTAATRHDFRGTVVWSHRSNHTFAIRTQN